MKKLIIFFFVLTCLSITGQNQKNAQGSDKEIAARQGLAASYLKENYYPYKTAEAKATHKIILEAFIKTSQVLTVSLDKITDADDKANVTSLIGGLNSILVLTPSWEGLIILEKQKLLQEDKAANRKPQLLENKSE